MSSYRAPRPENLLRRWWRERKIELAALVDSRTVRLFQLIMYVAFAAAGIYAVLYAKPPEPVNRVVGPLLYLGWGWLCAASAITALIGFLPPGREVRQRNLATSGKTNKVLFQLAGDTGMFVAFLVYVYSMWTTGYWRVSAFGFAESIGLNCCVGLLIVGDLRALSRSEWIGRRRG